MPRDVSALSGAISAPPTYGGRTAPVILDTNGTTSVEHSITSNTVEGAEASARAYLVLHTSCAIVMVALILLWVFGGIVFKNANI
jgi:hypothetical protein